MKSPGPNQARHANPAVRFPFDGFRRFESSWCALPARSGRVGALIRWDGKMQKAHR